MKKLVIAMLVAAFSTAGCSSIFNPAGSDEFACPGMPKGISCKSPREVYRITDKDKLKKGKGADMPTYLFATEPRSEGALNPVPVLEQAKVMRVWVAPWIDANNDQHWPGLVFTVIQPKQWHFGDQEFEGVEPPIPHRMFGAAPVVPSAAKTNSSADLPKNEDEVLN